MQILYLDRYLNFVFQIRHTSVLRDCAIKTIQSARNRAKSKQAHNIKGNRKIATKNLKIKFKLLRQLQKVETVTVLIIR